jgi:AcrR family transcriptional regulator
MTERTSGGDPARTLRLLWREPVPAGRRGPRPSLDVDAVVEAAIALADAGGLDTVSMRAVAARLGVTAMTLYTYVPGKAELLDLMLDAVYAGMPRDPWPSDAGWRSRLAAVAGANRDLYAAHPWAARVSTVRPPLGPGQLAKYEHELGALDGLGLDELAMDSALTHLLGFVQWTATAALDAAAAPGTDEAWWAEAGPLLARVADPARYPLASRVGSSAGEAQGAAFDADRAYAFGLERTLDGLGALIGRSSG